MSFYIGVVNGSINHNFYFILIASLRQHTNTLAIFRLNLALGWTFLSWMAALIWSVKKENKNLDKIVMGAIFLLWYNINANLQ
ncbi:MAG: superinfection immunity protein [Candidatus Omnitrophica bacterium]|nr:superinfection immunity protein [Candidatus Omnitrophota bacterium]